MRSQIKTGALLSYVTIGINILIGLLYTPWMLHSIGRNNFGLYTLAMSVISLFVFDFGLSSAVTRFIAKYLAEGRQDKANDCLGLVYKLYIGIDLVLFAILTCTYFFIPYIYDSLTPEEISKFKVVYAIAAIFSVISFPFIPVNGILNANENFIQVKLADVINKLLIVGLMSGCLLLGFGLYALVLVNAAAGIIMIAIKLYFVKRYTKTRVNYTYKNAGERKEILKFSGWTTVISICQRLIFNLAPSILGIMSGAASIAILGVAITIEGYTYTFANALNGMFLPRISRMLASDGDNNILPLMIRVGRIQVMVIFTFFIIFCCVGREFINLWVGSEYDSAFWCSLLLIFPGLIHLPQEIASTAIIATNNVKYQAYAFVGMSICNIALAFWFSAMWGAIGICGSICIAYLVRTLGMNFIYSRKLNIRLSEFFKKTYRNIWFPLIAVSLAAFVCDQISFSVSWLGFIGKSLILFIICIITYWVSFTNSEEKKLICSLFSKLN